MCASVRLGSNATLIVKYHIDKKWFGLVSGCAHRGEMDHEMH